MRTAKQQNPVENGLVCYLPAWNTAGPRAKDNTAMHEYRNTHKAQMDVRTAPPNDNVVDEASRQLTEAAKRRKLISLFKFYKQEQLPHEAFSNPVILTILYLSYFLTVE